MFFCLIYCLIYLILGGLRAVKTKPEPEPSGYSSVPVVETCNVSPAATTFFIHQALINPLYTTYPALNRKRTD